jgi:hypothetical protein
MRIFSLLTIIGLTVVLFGCGGGGGNPVNPPRPDKTAEWTVMFYMGGDNTLARFVVADLVELERVGSTDNVHFTALADVYSKTEGFSGLPIITTIVDSTGTPVTPMMHITKHPEEGVQSHLADPQAVLYPMESYNSADPANLTNLIRWSKQRFPAKHYALVIMDHGSSWLPGRASSAAVYDEHGGNGNAMYVHEIEAAIKNSGVRFDLLYFDACDMASVEAAYQLRDVTDYVCASQKVKMAGLNNGCYEEIASFLTSTPKADAETLGKKIVDIYVEAWSENGQYSVTHSLIRTDKLAAVAGAVGQLSGLLVQPQIISSNELQATFYEPIRFHGDVDICNFAAVLPYHVQNPTLQYALNLVREKTLEAVVYNKVFVSSVEGQNWTHLGTRVFGDGEDTNVNGVCGLNIFLPTERDWTQDNFSYYSSIGFTVDTGWNRVIARAYEGIPYLGMAPGGWLSMLVWSTNVDLDFWIFEPDGYGNLVPASPVLGPLGTNGYLSPDSYWTGISAEAYQAFPKVIWGPYFFLAVYSGPSLFQNAAWCALGFFDNPSAEEPAIVSNDYYISALQPVDPDFGPGVVFFGFLFYDPPTDTWWYFENDRTGESVTQDQIGSIAGQLQQLGPQTADSKLRRPQGIDQATIDQWSKQGAELAERLRQTSGNPSGLDTDSGWARAH